ncbi:hypothetical protein [Streptacidiphilus albus]|uniref:hypothetical protein n=1 Tax=Streptacidiphilus albus TaxID=105425 RepID=UPI001E4BA86C|nr:hypothetical protein [Streptacidiphilus albus]
MVDSPSPRSGQMLDPDQAPGKEQPVGTRAPVLGTALPLAATPGQAPSPSVPANPPRTPEQPKDQPRDPLKEPQPDPFSELSALYGLTERLTASSTLEDTLRDVLEAGATLVGAQRGMVLLTESSDGRPPAFGTVRAPGTIVGLGFDHSALGALETVPRDSAMYAGLLNGCSQVLNPGPLNADPLNAGPPSAGPPSDGPSNAAPSNAAPRTSGTVAPPCPDPVGRWTPWTRTPASTRSPAAWASAPPSRCRSPFPARAPPPSAWPSGSTTGRPLRPSGSSGWPASTAPPPPG